MLFSIIKKKNLYICRNRFAYSAHVDDASVCVSQHLPGGELTPDIGLTSAIYT